MCGIAGVYGSEAVVKACALMLGQLERGVKGAGVAYWLNGRLSVVKAPIHPVKFIFDNPSLLRVTSRVAIAHNRQPAGSGVSFENTHPFLACSGRFALIHNGVSWNYYHERERMTRVHTVKGQTDSELIMHKLEEYARNGGLVHGFERLYNDNVMGAFLVLTVGGALYAARDNMYPLHMYVDGVSVMFASSAKAFECVGVEAKSVEALKDFEVVVVREGRVKRYTLSVTRSYGYDVNYGYNYNRFYGLGYYFFP